MLVTVECRRINLHKIGIVFNINGCLLKYLHTHCYTVSFLFFFSGNSSKTHIYGYVIK